MTKEFQNINEEEVLFFDIETVRRNKELEVDSKEYSLYQKKTRNRDTDEFLEDKDLLEMYEKKGALKMCYNKVITIGVGYIRKDKDNIPKVYIKSIEGTEEEVILEFCNIASRFKYVCGANILAFDLPMIINNGWRYFSMPELLPDKFITSGKKPWELKSVVDLMNEFKGTHYYSSTVEEMCYHFGVPTPKDDISGEDVSRVYYSEGIERILKYVKKDVLANINLFRKMQFKDIFTDFVDRSSVKEEKKPVLERIYLNNQITKQDKDEIKELLGAKRLTKKSKNILKDMIYQLSLKSELFKKDKKEVKEQKLEEVNELIDNL